MDFSSDGDGEGGFATLSHCPNGGFGDAGRGLSDGGFSPLTSSSSPPDTGAFARGELRSGRVLDLPGPAPEAGDGESEGKGNMGVGCSRGVCNDNESFDGDPGGVVLCARGNEEALGCGAGRGVGSTLIEGPSALGVLEGERESGKGMAVGSIPAGGGTLFSSSSDSPSTCS